MCNFFAAAEFISVNSRDMCLFSANIGQNGRQFVDCCVGYCLEAPVICSARLLER